MAPCCAVLPLHARTPSWETSLAGAASTRAHTRIWNAATAPFQVPGHVLGRFLSTPPSLARGAGCTAPSQERTQPSGANQPPRRYTGAHAEQPRAFTHRPLAARSALKPLPGKATLRPASAPVADRTSSLLCFRRPALLSSSLLVFRPTACSEARPSAAPGAGRPAGDRLPAEAGGACRWPCRGAAEAPRGLPSSPVAHEGQPCATAPPACRPRRSTRPDSGGGAHACVLSPGPPPRQPAVMHGPAGPTFHRLQWIA
jgi:hypothetical protein